MSEENLSKQLVAKQLLELDKAHVWHPYTSLPGLTGPLLIESASGVRLRLAEPIEGQVELIDGMSSWWAAIHGYTNPVLDKALTDQLAKMSHVMFGGLTHEPAITLVKRLVDITPESLQHVFLSDSGSVAVEVAIKMCLQYWREQGMGEKRRLMTWRGGYYGDTYHPMSVCDPEGGMHHLWGDTLPKQLFAQTPPKQITVAYIAHLSKLVSEHAHELAAIIVEPVVQGAGGMRFHDPECLQILRELASANDVLLIFDEIATGFGRTGELWAANHADVSPDVMCVGKAMTGGYMTQAATLATTEVAHGVGMLAHGPTFMGNPLASAVSNASIDLLLSQPWKEDVTRIESVLAERLEPANRIDGVVDVRVKGAIGVVQLDHPVDVEKAIGAAIQHGVWLRPFRDLIYTMPPYVTDNEEVAQISKAIVAAAEVS